MHPLSLLGWTDEFDQKWQALSAPGLQPARVVADFGTSLKVATPEVITAELSGKLAHYSRRDAAPKVGDWVAVRISANNNAVIEQAIPRRNEIARKVAGKQTVKQIIAANVDVAFVLLALDNDFNIERLRRFLYQLSVSAVAPVILLNKADKVSDLQPYIEQLRQFGLPIIVANATAGIGATDMLQHISAGQTAILLGSSGVGKSTLTNLLLQRAAQKTQEVRARDASGKHTTVHRELFILPNGGLLIDTPGVRELQLWGTEDQLSDTFEDIALLVRQCKYTSCQHTTEAGCAIRAALRDGSLDPARYASYSKLRGELSRLKDNSAIRTKKNNVRSWKKSQQQTKEALDDLQDGVR